MRSLRFAAFALATLALVALPATRSYASVVPMDLEAMVSSANSIVEVRVTGSSAHAGKDVTSGERGDIVTDTKVHVTKVLKGRKSGDLTLTQPGGVLGDRELVFSDLPTFAPGERCLLFLNAEGGVVGGYQGKLPIVDGTVQSLGLPLKAAESRIDALLDGEVVASPAGSVPRTDAVQYAAYASIGEFDTILGNPQVAQPTGQVNILYSESFEFAPNDWAGWGDGAEFGVTDYRASTGMQSLYWGAGTFPAPGPGPEYIYGEYGRVTPVSLVGYKIANFEFDAYSNMSAEDPNNNLAVMFAKDPGGPWYTSNQFVVGSTGGGWTHVNIDLRSVTDFYGFSGTESFTGGDVYFTFVSNHNTGAEDEGVYVDDVIITGEPGPVINDISPMGRNAGIGETVTISGSGFGDIRGAGKVEFQDGRYTTGIRSLATTVTSWTNTSITCEVPRFAKSGNVFVTTDPGVASDGSNYSVGFSAGGPKSVHYPTVYRINENCVDVTGEGAAIQAAFAVWNGARSNLTFTYGGTTNVTVIPPHLADGVNEIYFSSDFPDTNLLAMNYTAFANGEIIESGIAFNERLNWANGAVPGAYDIQSLAIHELGHTVGFDDQYGELVEVMGHGRMNTIRRTLTQTEIDGALYLHGNADSIPPTTPIVPSNTQPSGTSRYRDPAPGAPFVATDESGIAGYSYSVDEFSNTTPDMTAEGAGTSKSIPDLPNGISYFHVRAQDMSGNWGAASHLTLRIDTILPTLSCPQDSVLSSAPILVGLNATDTLSGVAAVSYGIDTAPSIPYTGSFTVATQGAHKINYSAADAAGNVAVASATVTYDSVAPVSSSDAPANWVAGPVAVTLTSSDTVSGVSRIVYALDGGTAATYSAPISVSGDGTHTIAYAALDVAGNRETTKTATVKVDNTAPVTGNNAPASWVNAPVDVTLTPVDPMAGISSVVYTLNGSGSATYSGPIHVSAEGTNTLLYRAIDTNGNSEATKTATIKIDTTAPAISTDATSTWSKGPVTAHLTTTDGGSGVASVLYSTNGSAPSLPYTGGIIVSAEGTTTVRYQAIDAVGNASAIKSVDVRLDNSAPVSTDTAPASWVAGPASVTLSSTDSYSGMYGILYTLDGSVATLYSSPLVVSAEGTHTITYAGIDLLSNREATKTATVRIDKTAPVTSNDAPAGWQKADVTVHLTATDAQAGVDKTYYSLDGSAPSIVATSGTIISAEGTTTLKYYTADKVGNAETVKSVTVLVDKTKPTTGNDAPTAWQSAPVTVHLTSSDGHSGVAGTRFSVNGAAVATYTAAGITVAAEGTNTVSFATVDVAGNWESTQTATVKIDTTAPNTTSDAHGIYVGTATVALSPADAGSGTSLTRWRADGGDWTVGTTAGVSGVGTHTVDWYSVDQVGNQEVAKSTTFAIVDRVDDTNSRIVYQGGWTTNANVGRYQGSWKVAAATGQKAYITFTGTRFDIIGSKAPTYGMVKVTIDGGTVENADFYASGYVHLQRVYSKSGLANTQHTAIVEWAGTKNAASTGYTAGIDAIDIAGTLDGDTVAPVTTDTAPGAWRATAATVTLSATDAHSYVSTTCYRINGSAVTTYTVPFPVSAEGTNTIEYWSVDGAGNTEATKTATVRIDKTAPAVSDDAPAVWTKGPVTLHITALDAASGVGSVVYSTDGSAPSLPYTGSIVIGAEGTTTVKYQATDAVGNSTNVRTTTVRVDDTAPSSSDDAPTGWISGTANVHLTSTDALSGVTGISFTLDGSDPATYETPITVSGEGTHTITYSATDAAGNTEATKTVTVRIDDTAPTSTDDAPVGWVSGPVFVTLTPVDPISGVNAVLYSTDGSEPTVPYTGPIVVASQGVTTIKYTSIDTKGNVEPTKTTTVSIDDVAPVTTDNAPTGWVSAPVSVALTAEDFTSGVAQTNVTVDGESFTYSSPLIFNSEGIHTLSYASTDVKGNRETTKTVTVRIDDTAPTSTDDAPVGWVSGPVFVTLTPVDPISGVNAVLYSTDGSEPTVPYTGPVVVASQGVTTIKYAAIDTKGNVEPTRLATVSIDDVAPVTTDNAPSAWIQGPVDVTLSVVEQTSGLAVTDVTVDGSASTYTEPLHLTTEGTHTITYASTDVKGNRETTKTVIARVDDTAPPTAVTPLSPTSPPPAPPWRPGRCCGGHHTQG